MPLCGWQKDAPATPQEHVTRVLPLDHGLGSKTPFMAGSAVRAAPRMFAGAGSSSAERTGYAPGPAPLVRSWVPAQAAGKWRCDKGGVRADRGLDRGACIRTERNSYTDEGRGDAP